MVGPTRFVVVPSSSLDVRQEHKLECVLEREQTELQKTAKSLGKNVYSCQQDAQAAAGITFYFKTNPLRLMYSL